MFEQIVISVLGGVIVVFVIRAIDSAAKHWHNRSMAAEPRIHLQNPVTGFALCGVRVAELELATCTSDATCPTCFDRRLLNAPKVIEPPLTLGPRKELPPLPRQKRRRGW